MTTEIRIRPETAVDEPAVRALLTEAFAGSSEAALVDRLRRRPEAVILVAERAGAVAGVVVFSPVTGNHPAPGLHAAGLAPVAVRPDCQNQGIGTALVRAGIEACRARSLGLLVVLGHPNYYPRFGFRPAASIGLRCRWSHDADDGAFMYLELETGHAALAGDFVEYCREFDDL